MPERYPIGIAMPKKAAACFTPETFRFLRDLKRNNRRDWFERHKPRYEETVRQPCLRFIADLAEPLRVISPHYVASAKPVGGSLFRIHRDTRFSNDKSPYKTHAGMSFYHEATRATPRGDGGNAAMGRLDAPVFYLHLEPGACFIGGGLWHPQPETIKRVREYLVANPASWKQATRSARFRKHYELEGAALSRPPQGYDPQHELIEDLKRKDFVCTAALSEEQLCAPGAMKTVLEHYRLASPMIDWLCGALDLDY